MKAASIFLSALFTASVAQSLGLLTLQLLRPKLTREEQYLYGFVCGSAVLSLAVFAIAALHLVWTATFVVFGIAAITCCIYKKAYAPFPSRFEPTPMLYKVLLACAVPAYVALYFLHALAPEASPDGSSYHLGLVQTYIDQHGFGRITTDMYANLPLGAEMLYLFAFSLGRHSAAALVHFCFLLVLPLLMIAVGRRSGFVRAGALGAVLVFLSPVFGVDGTTAYVDVALACTVFALFGLLQTWDELRESSLLPLIGLLAGFAYAIKPTAFPAVLYAIGFVLYKLLRRRERLLRPLGLVLAFAAIMILPWLAKNAITVGNPLSPFANFLFPNPVIRISAEQSYSAGLRNYEGLQSKWDIPAELTIRGAILNGFFGPAFLLAPLGLLSLRWKFGRQLLLASAVFASTYPANVGTRFLMAAAPFVAFAIGMAVSHWRGMAPLLIVFHSLSSWPDFLTTYANPYAWRIERFYWDAAFRIQPESEYLDSRLAGYSAAKLTEQYVPRDGVVFTPGGIAQAYCRRQVIVGYQSAVGNRLWEYIAAATTPHFQPGRWWTYSFPRRTVEKLRVSQTEVSQTNIWSVSEFRIFGPSGELPRANWRLRAQPNPWDVQHAFDNCPVTRWYSAQAARPSMFIEVTLPAPTELTAVRIEATLDQKAGTAKLEVEDGGRWVGLSDTPAITSGVPETNMRRRAMDDFKREGVTHLSMLKSEYFTADIAADPARWGLTLLGENAIMRVYRID